MVLEKVKGVFALEERITQLSKKVDEHSAKIDEQSKIVESGAKSVGLLKDEIGKVNTDTAAIYLEFMDQLSVTKKLNEELKNDIYDFKLLKGQLKSKLVDELTENFRLEIAAQSKKLEADIRTYNDLKQELAKVVSEIQALRQEIEKFTKISSQIKSADFELARYAREVTRVGQEKRKLADHADRLESAIARERRRN